MQVHHAVISNAGRLSIKARSRTTAVNESHYEAVLPDRERGLIDSLPAFGMTA